MPEEEDPSSVMDFVPQVHMLVTEINPVEGPDQGHPKIR